ncbi:F-box/kelch-repeat protein At5g15710-like [Typha latifolia]|uniref:F-box/kelch-repeat protein At5g15710-like n=1 Tax=Typha latifolia TaxID=4733 RepID=UPI003C2FD018
MDRQEEVSKPSGKDASFSEGDSSKKEISETSKGIQRAISSQDKMIMKKPQGLIDELDTTFARGIQADIPMDDGIWSRLPEDLLIEVLARVPPILLFQMRSVCRRWNSIFNDRRFLTSHSKVPSHGPCLLTFWNSPQIRKCLIFSFPLKAWYGNPFAFLPAWASWLVGSSNGLVCFAGYDGFHFKILVCNPLLQTWRTLPRMHYNEKRRLVLAVDRIDRSFKIIAASSICGKAVATEVYDSKLNCWTIHEVMPTLELCSAQMALCDSRLYVETISPLGLLMYRLDTGRWEQISVVFPGRLIDAYLVAGAQKRLFLVGRIGLNAAFQSVQIWELDHAKSVWKELSRMPPTYFRALMRLSAERFECFGQDNLIFFTSLKQGTGALFDAHKKSWSWIASRVIHGCSSQVCIYEPRFDTSIC